MFKYTNVFVLSILSLLILNCAESPISSNNNNEVPELERVDSLLIESDNTFGCNMFRSLVKTEGDKNVIISPLSIAMALGMVYNGAEGDTKKAMEATMGLSGLTRQEINESYQRIIKFLTELDHDVAFQIANSIWALEGYPFKQPFFDVNKKYFDAEIQVLDLYQPEAADAINQWVYDNTNGKIEKIVKYENIVADQIRLLLINAIYFKGAWTYLFKEKNTYDATFYKSDNSTIQCRMMNQEGKFFCLRNELFQAIELPYGNELYSMIIFVPHSSVTVDSLIAEFTAGKFNQWVGSFTEKEGVVLMPKFKLEYKTNLNDVLKALGMEIAFGSGADFSGIAETGIHISKVIHKTFIEVNEEGTEAAAVTVITMIDSGPEILIRADRPFLFVLREKLSNTILFMGKVTEPKV